MTCTGMLNLNNLQLYEYQALLRELLKKSATIADKLMKCLDYHGPNNKTDNGHNKLFMNIPNAINQEIKNIDRFELRMVVVAQMKSGKSTIINALIGDNILPTRGNAMTILPTEVVFNRDIDRPTLMLTKEAIDLIVQLQLQIQSYRNPEEIDAMLENQSHLVEILKGIVKAKSAPFFVPTLNTVESEHIQATLTFINDLVRIYFILSKKTDNNFGNMSLKPLLQPTIRLEIPVTNLNSEYMNDIETSIGSLSIVDTPGPNEAAGSQELQEIVVGELQKAGIIILILNFTSMGTDADQKIYDEIRAIREANIDSDCIYVIVNKVDQRRKTDMKKDDVKKFVATAYKISQKTEQPSDRRIFEMKGVHCLTFRRFMKELEDLRRTNPNVLVKDMKTADELKRELYLNRGSDDDDEIDLDRLCDDAKRMWKYAGLKEFVEGPIGDLFQKTAPRSIQSALNVCLRSGIELQKQIIDRQKLLAATKESLEKESTDIQNDCGEIVKLEKQNRDILNNTLAELREKINEMIMKVGQQNHTSSSLHEKRVQESSSETTYNNKKTSLGTGLILGGLIAATILSGGSVGLAAAAVASGATIIHNINDDIKFKNTEEAKKVLEQMNEDIYKSCNKHCESVCHDIEILCNTANNALNKHIVETTSGIIRKANERLKKNFSIELVTLETLTIETTKVNVEIEKVIQMYRPLWGYALFGRKAKILEKDDISKIPEIKSQISRKEIADICEKSVDRYLTEFQDTVNKHFAEVLVTTFESYFVKLNAHFRDYAGVIKDTLREKTHSKEKQEQFSSALESILKDLEPISENVTKIANELRIKPNRS
ncbi:unnamed protein product [Rotaria socialis]|uniref:Dynamin N-terminal domain-containing protein n=1 Tax=Rotaria socialis TaxID=392032 RepID=A0A818KTC3_9BILA|nr:unnamed protein product [Rotaria socialis]CAF4880321.1 unnamed protein product [Rotaria socialis]